MLLYVVGQSQKMTRAGASIVNSSVWVCCLGRFSLFSFYCKLSANTQIYTSHSAFEQHRPCLIHIVLISLKHKNTHTVMCTQGITLFLTSNPGLDQSSSSYSKIRCKIVHQINPQSYILFFFVYINLCSLLNTSRLQMWHHCDCLLSYYVIDSCTLSLDGSVPPSLNANMSELIFIHLF